MSVHIRIATRLDRDDIRDVHLRAFPEGENQLVAELAVNLLSEETDPETINLVAEIGGVVVGHVAFSPVTAESDMNWCGYILAPLGVKPLHHNRGIGSKLIESGKERIVQNGVNVLFVYGDPMYYGRFGFRAETASKFSPPYALKYSFGWQAVVLIKEGFCEHAAKLSCVASLRDPVLW